ncbi:MAG: cysteine-rich small domain-containing protein [Bacilli bacterium]
MKNSHKFFKNSECKYFPCHKTNDIDSFNCMFCFCPLYCLGDKCGGKFEYTATGVKSCIECELPHRIEFYDEVIKRLNEKE